MAEMIKCKKCGKMIDNRGITMHENFCKGTEQNEEKKIDKNESVSKCIECKSNNVIRLDEYQKKSGKKFDLKKLYDMGYTHVCLDCNEVLK